MPVYAIADNIISPLGITTMVNFKQLLSGNSGIRQHNIVTVHNTPFFASLFSNDGFAEHAQAYTKFERLLIHSISSALQNCSVDITSATTGIVLATTKGNIGLLETRPVLSHKLPLHYSAALVAAHFGNPNEPVVVSNACTSGLTAIMVAKRMLETGKYRNVVVAGADVISRFIFSGFNAFQAISSQACKPYDAGRNGVTLGEAAATIVLSSKIRGDIRVTGAGATNDANHISGPSRTGAELAAAMQKAMAGASITAGQIDYISAHGTATVYNDEMEAKAINLLAMSDVPVNSLKGYYGHTLGTAGILETIIAMECMRANVLLPTQGFSQLGVTEPITVIKTVFHKRLNHCLKTASGFGGCNAAIVLSN